MDLRFDVATYNGQVTGNASDGNQDWFGNEQEPYLNFPSVNGHNIEQGNDKQASALSAAGNTLGMYYDTFDDMYSDGDTTAQAVSAIQSWAKTNFGVSNTGNWLVLNEVNGSVWNNTTTGSGYRSWLVSTMSALHTAGYNNVILYAESSLASAAYASTWQGITQYAYIGDECYIDGPVVQADNFNVATLQATYQASYNAWTESSVAVGHTGITGAGIPASKLLLGEEFSVNVYEPSTYWGADGTSGTVWEEAIEARDLAIDNIPFGGFIGYAWDKDGEATGDSATDLANQIAYEKAYASTLVTQTEIPAWTGNDGTTSWNDYLNWTGGLPSTTSAPYPLLAATNPNLPLQTAANFMNAITHPTTITLDGNQSIETLTFDNSVSYTIAPGAGGSLTFAQANPLVPVPLVLTVTLGSHSITAPVVVSGNLSANITGALTLSGGLSDGGYSITKTGSGTLNLEGPQSYTVGSALAVSAGTVVLTSDGGSAASANLGLSVSAGTVNLDSSQHLASLALTGGRTSVFSNGGFISTHSFAISSSAVLNLGLNDMIVDYTGSASPAAAIQSALASGYAAGAWNGNGIISSAISTNPGTSLGYAEASEVLGISGSQTATFDNQTVDATTVLVKFTWLGDANLDGIVDASDLAMMSPTGTTWDTGDFNYDGVVNADDYALFALGAAFGQYNISVVVPEPSIVALIALPALFALRRRRGTCSI